LPVRQIKKLRLLANVLPAMLDHMAKGDMPDERQLRTIASAALEDQKEVWKKHKPSKADPQVSWWGDDAKLHHDHHEHAEPDRIEAGVHRHRIEERHGQYYGRQRVH